MYGEHVLVHGHTDEQPFTRSAWAGAVALAARGSRLRVLAGTGLGAALAAAAVLLAADVGRGRYLDSLQQDGLPRTAVASMFDALVEPLQSLSWTVLIAGLVVAGVAVLGSRGWTTGRILARTDS